MAYTDDAVLAKLSALNETHDSIATAAQWIMFHRRHAERTVQLWFQRLKDSPSPKRLNLIYLANEVSQQSKARHKEDFVLAFSPVIADAIAAAYKGAPSEMQLKLRRVVDVWRDRAIFEAAVQAAVETRIGELDKARGAQRTGGGSIFGSGNGHGGNSQAAAAAAFPPELAALVAPQQSVTKMLLSTQSSASKAESDFDKTMNGPVPAAPVYAARLNGLLKTIVDAEHAMAQLVRARTDLRSALEALQAECQGALEADIKQLEAMAQRKVEVDTRKREVEDRILRGLNGLDQDGSGTAGGGGVGGGSIPMEPVRPMVEALTPPATEQDDPLAAAGAASAVPEALAAPQQQQGLPIVDGRASGMTRGAAVLATSDGNGSNGHNETTPAPTLPVSISSASGIEILSHLASQAIPVSTNGANKRRRLDADDGVPNLDDSFDADVTETLRQESGM